MAEGAALRIDIRLEFAAVEGWTDVSATWWVEPRGCMRGVSLVVERTFRRQLDQHQAQIARGLTRRVVRND